MKISQKCYYALWAIFELAKNGQRKPVPMATIAEAWDIPPMFLQVILREMKQGGFVQSQRGKQGGYALARPAAEITLGDVIRFVDGHTTPTDCVTPDGRITCERSPACPFSDVWLEVTARVNEVYDRVTFAELVERARQRNQDGQADYVI